MSVLLIYVYLIFLQRTKMSLFLEYKVWGFFISYLFDMLSCVDYALLEFRINVQNLKGA